MDGITAYALSKKVAASAVSGVKSMSVDGQTLTINTKDSGVLKMVFPVPKDGLSVTDIDVNANNQIVFTMSDGTEFISGKIPTVKGDPFKYSDFTSEQLDALKGQDGVSPTITENADNTDKIYKLDVTTADGTFTTPNLKGADGTGGTGGGEENVQSDWNETDDTADGFIKNKPTIPDITGLATETYVDNKVADYTKTVDLADVATSGSYNDLADKPTIPSLDGYAKTSEIPSKVSELENDSNYLSSIPEEYVTETELSAKGYLTEHQDISGKVDKVEGKSLISDAEITRLATVDNYNDTQVKTQIQAVANGLMDSVGYSADYKTIDIIAKNGVKKSVNVAPIISHASITELSDVDTTNKATGKALVYNATTSKHEYTDVSGTDEKVKMDASTDAKYLGELLDNITIANENGELKVKKLDGQEVTITEINYLKGLTMNVMDLVNMFSNGGVKIINTPVATYAELLTLDKSSFIEGISYLVYVLADENHDNAKTTYLVDKDSETPTYFGFADSQRDFTTNPIDLATEITGKLGISNMDSDAIKALFTVDDTYKTETATNNAFSTHGAKALYDELLLAIGNKANSSDLTTHKNDTAIHVSTEDRTNWDSAKTHADSAHAPSNAQENVIETVKVNGTALEVSNKAVNVTVPTAVSELTDSSSYAKKTDIPITLPADGGNSDTVNNHTVKSDVPENAVFTDTTYSDATQIEHGLMSVDDKKKLDGLKKYTPDGSTITADEDGTLHGVAKVTVDTAISQTSTNPVQNKVVKAYVDKKVSENVDFSTSTSKTLNDTVEAPLVLSNSTRNLLNPTLATTTKYGVTCTNNGDGTYTLNGTATKDRWISFGYTTLKPGKYKFIATENNVRVNNLCVSLNSTVIAMSGDIFTVQSKGVYDIGLSTYNKTFNNVLIKPMITTDLSATYDDFVSYSGYDIKTCGKNLLNLTKITTNNTGVTASLSNGIITLDGTVDTSDGWQDIYFNTPEQYVSLKRGVKYTISTKDKVQKVFILLRKATGLEILYTHDCYTNGTTFVASEDMVCQVTITFKESSTFNNTQIAPQIEVGEKATEYEPYNDGGTVHIDSTTEFPLLGLKSFDGETNIISPGNVEVTYAKSDSGAAILDTSENKLDKDNVVNNQTTTVAGFALDARQANPNIDGTLAKQVHDLNGKVSIVSDVRKETTVNLLKLTLQTTTQNGITCTNNGDGTYTLNGTATTQTTFIFANADYTLATFKGHSSLKLVGFPKKYASAGVLQVWRQSDNLIMRDRGDGVIITGSNMPYGNCNMAFVIYEGAVTDGMIIKPMLTTNLNATYDDFVPYTGDGDSLNWDVASLLKRIETLESLVNKADTTVTG